MFFDVHARLTREGKAEHTGMMSKDDVINVHLCTHAPWVGVILALGKCHHGNKKAVLVYVSKHIL